jgi:alanine racemase
MSSNIRYAGAMASPSSTHASAPGPESCARELRASVDMDRLAGNLKLMRKASRGLGILAAVKADAYGHGAVQVARTLESANVDGFCVATLQEALELRRAGLSSRILVFGGIRSEAVAVAAAHAIDLTVVSADHLRELAILVPQHPVGLHVKLDTGMGRSGILLSELGSCLDLIRGLRPWIQGVMGHFSSAEDPDPAVSTLQRRRFLEARRLLGDAGIAPSMIHHGNSVACLRGFTEGDSHVRCGISLYGICDLEAARQAGLQPILELSAEVFRAVRVPAGTTVGYGCSYVAPQPVKLATLSCGYADGYPRALAHRARVGFRGETFPVVGKISMDSLTVAVPETLDIVAGDRMILLSREGGEPHSVVNTARLLGTIPYEVTCALNRRVLREPA